jgi:hypothetical protein
VTINGAFTAPADTYIMLEGAARTFADGVLGTAPYSGYLIYADASNAIRVKADVTAVCMIGATLYADLGTALAAEGSAKTIKLLADIDYNTGIGISGSSLTFDLNGHTLNVTSSTGHALSVTNGRVDMVGAGEFNVTSSAGDGVHVENNGYAALTSATSTKAEGYGAYASGSGSRVEVAGDAIATGSGAVAAKASGGGVVTVGGSARGPVGALAGGVGSGVEIMGDSIAALHGAQVSGGAFVRIHGNVTVPVPRQRAF